MLLFIVILLIHCDLKTNCIVATLSFAVDFSLYSIYCIFVCTDIMYMYILNFIYFTTITKQVIQPILIMLVGTDSFCGRKPK